MGFVAGVKKLYREDARFGDALIKPQRHYSKEWHYIASPIPLGLSKANEAAKKIVLILPLLILSLIVYPLGLIGAVIKSLSRLPPEQHRQRDPASVNHRPSFGPHPGPGGLPRRRQAWIDNGHGPGQPPGPGGAPRPRRAALNAHRLIRRGHSGLGRSSAPSRIALDYPAGRDLGLISSNASFSGNPSIPEYHLGLGQLPRLSVATVLSRTQVTARSPIEHIASHSKRSAAVQEREEKLQSADESSALVPISTCAPSTVVRAGNWVRERMDEGGLATPFWRFAPLRGGSAAVARFETDEPTFNGFSRKGLSTQIEASILIFLNIFELGAFACTSRRGNLLAGIDGVVRPIAHLMSQIHVHHFNIIYPPYEPYTILGRTAELALANFQIARQDSATYFGNLLVRRLDGGPTEYLQVSTYNISAEQAAAIPVGRPITCITPDSMTCGLMKGFINVGAANRIFYAMRIGAFEMRDKEEHNLGVFAETIAAEADHLNANWITSGNCGFPLWGNSVKLKDDDLDYLFRLANGERCGYRRLRCGIRDEGTYEKGQPYIRLVNEAEWQQMKKLKLDQRAINSLAN